MFFFQDWLFEYPILSAIYLAFVVWILVDISRREVDRNWIWIILVVPLAGPVAYFIVHMLPSWNLALPIFRMRKSLAELKFRAEQSPTLTNQLALAERLMERREHAAAVPYLEAARKKEPGHGQVLFRLAECHLELGTANESAAILDELINRDPRWADYAAWKLKVKVHDALEQPDALLEAARKLVKQSPTLDNKCMLAEHLADLDHAHEARQLLDQALEEMAFAPGQHRRRNWRAVWRAKRILKRLP